ncbi:hypothetical protein LMB75_00905, partial [Limosilactobacillus reuteri]|nr:hypothetical protein [Limosilactobacillus reuteri]
LPRDITAPSTNNQLVSIIYLSPVANLFLKFRCLNYLSENSKEIKIEMKFNNEVPNNALVNHV